MLPSCISPDQCEFNFRPADDDVSKVSSSSVRVPSSSAMDQSEPTSRFLDDVSDFRAVARFPVFPSCISPDQCESIYRPADVSEFSAVLSEFPAVTPWISLSPPYDFPMTCLTYSCSRWVFQRFQCFHHAFVQTSARPFSDLQMMTYQSSRTVVSQ